MKTHISALLLASIIILSLDGWAQPQDAVAATPGPARAYSDNRIATASPANMDVGVDSPVVPVTLKEAVDLALEKSPVRKAVLADQKIAAAAVREAKSALLPRLTFSESATRGNDPVYAFGTRLRQGRFTAADFALNQLNSPLPIGNFATRFGGQWNLFSAPDWLNIGRVKEMKAAAARQLQRGDQQLVLRVVSAYHHLLLAIKQQQLAEQQVQTSESILQASKTRYDSGLAVESDFLSAQVNDAARRQELIRATNAVLLARAQLSTAMGVPIATVFEPQEISAERELPLIALPDAEARALASRPDLKEIELRQAAAQVGTRMAKSAFAPKVSAFADWEQDNPALFGGGSNNWLGGVEVQLDLFTGGQKTAQLQRARALQEKAADLHQVALDEVRLEVRQAWYDADTARQQLQVVQTAIKQSEESLRITQTRYGAGLATITDVLQSEESRRRTQTDYWQAVYGYQTALANLDLAMGTLSDASAVVQ